MEKLAPVGDQGVEVKHLGVQRQKIPLPLPEPPLMDPVCHLEMELQF
jgi:hypothetical protein